VRVSIQFDQITKRYRGIPVVNDVTIEIPTGEFFVLLGPSGSGKSTLLRAVAGLTGIDRGRIALHGRDVTHVEPRHRGVGFVFQHYALFRNMTVAENIEFALRVRRMRAAQRVARRKDLLKLVDLEGMDERLTTQLSGGQQQRVAVARALAHEPAVLLLDEPFGALDAKIRVELRRTVRDVQRRLGTTTILVTHDQEEAFALGDRIGVMHNGRLLETGRPEQLYRQPATRFVAKFLGAANILLGRRVPEGVRLGAAVVDRPESAAVTSRNAEVLTVLRPEDVELAEHRTGLEHAWLADGTVIEATFCGGVERLRVALAADTLVRSAQGNETSGEEQAATLESARTAAEGLALPLQAGQRVAIGVRRVHVLPTPISGFDIYARSREIAARIRNSTLLSQLVRSMQATVTEVDWSAGTAGSGVAIQRSGVALVPAGAAAEGDIVRLASLGATRILCLPVDAPLPRRALICWIGERARPATLALAASLMRHLPVEATLLGLTDAGARSERANAFRRVLDARAEFRFAHGLDINTELHLGTLVSRIWGPAAQGEPLMLVVGIEGAPRDLAGAMSTHLGGLPAAPTPCPIFIVHQPAEFTEREATDASRGSRDREALV
jgi:sulfate/thiosulfate transport system ATP-binding protein